VLTLLLFGQFNFTDFEIVPLQTKGVVR